MDNLITSLNETAHTYPIPTAVIVFVLLLVLYLWIRKHIYFEHLTCDAYSDPPGADLAHFRKADVYLHKNKDYGFYKLDHKEIELKLHQINEIRDTRPEYNAYNIGRREIKRPQFRLYGEYVRKEKIEAKVEI